MLKLLSTFLRNPSSFFLSQRQQKLMIISLFSLLFVCILFFMIRGASRRANIAGDPNASPESLAPAPTQTKWWVMRGPSKTPVGLISSGQTIISSTQIVAVASECPPYTLDFKPGTFGYISLSPPYQNLVRSGAGKNYSALGFIEVGDWVRILGDPVCTDEGYVWLNVQSAAGSNSWTAGGHKTAQWVLPCPDPNKKCSKKRQSRSIPTTPDPSNNNDRNNSNGCVSDKLAVGLDAQVSPNDLLVVRSEPFIGSVIGRIAPLGLVNIIDGPKCAGGAVWWRVWGPQTGWAVEKNLRACPKEGDCDPWKNEQLFH